MQAVTRSFWDASRRGERFIWGRKGRGRRSGGVALVGGLQRLSPPPSESKI